MIRATPIAVVVVSYNRYSMLTALCRRLSALPWIPGDRIYIVDNASPDPKIQSYLQEQARQYPFITLLLQRENTGGAGGFYAGLRQAYQDGFEWFWIMDDDVLPLPDALQKIWKYTSVAPSIQVAKLQADGRIFEFEGRCSMRTLMRRYLIYSKVFRNCDFVNCQTANFEGMFFHRCVIDKIGLPDREFFLGWDDIYYGLKISRCFQNIYIKDICLQKQIDKKKLSIGGIPLLTSSLFSRYFHFRNFSFVICELRRMHQTSIFAWVIYWLEFSKACAITLFIEGNLRGIDILFRAYSHGISRDFNSAGKIFDFQGKSYGT